MSRGILISAVIVALVAGAAFATQTAGLSENYTLTLEASYSGASALSNAQNGIPDAVTANPGTTISPGTIFQFDVSALITGMAAGENWDNSSIGVTLPAGLSFVDDFGTGQNDLADSFDPHTPAGNQYKIGTTVIFTNDQINGSTPNEIIFAATSKATAHTKNPGVASTSPLDFGQLFVQYNSGTTDVLSIQGATANGGVQAYNFSTWQGNSSGTGTAQNYFGGTYSESDASVTFNPIPEPATMGLLLIGGIGALLRRRKLLPRLKAGPVTQQATRN
jgi:hypothetical protein